MESQIHKLHNSAINAAVSGDWQQAIALNKEILNLDENNIDAFLALGFAYLQTNQYDQSSKYYKKALALEPGNVIARNNLDKLAILKKKPGSDTASSDQNQSAALKEFINIVGKTKVVDLVNIGQSEVLANLIVGQQVEAKPKKRRVEIRTIEGDYIGALPDDISKRLLFFLEAQSLYRVYIKSALKNQVEVFLTEEKKGPKVKHFVSFPKNIQDDLKTMMQQLHKDDDDEDKQDGEEGEEGHDTEHEFDEDKQAHKAEEEDENEEITDLEALAADIDEEGHDTFMTDLSAYEEEDEESEE